MNLTHAVLRGLDPTWVMRQCGMSADRWQQRLLAAQDEQIFVLCSRQAGKSTTAAAKAVRKAVFEPGSLILLLSPSLRQSSELFRKVQQFYRPLSKEWEAEQQTALTLALKNGSRIVSLPGTGDTVRGYSSVALLVVDEACMVSEELYTAVRPMLAVSQGQLVALSTPKGKRGWFYEAWNRVDSPALKIRVPAEEVSRITPEFLSEELRSMGQLFFDQEYRCEFMDLEGALFTLDQIESAVTEEISSLDFSTSGDPGVKSLVF